MMDFALCWKYFSCIFFVLFLQEAVCQSTSQVKTQCLNSTAMLDCSNYASSPSRTSLRWEANVTGTYKAIATIRRNGFRKLPSDKRVIFHKNGSLEIKSVSHEDAGLYRCRVSTTGQRKISDVKLVIRCNGATQEIQHSSCYSNAILDCKPYTKSKGPATIRWEIPQFKGRTTKRLASRIRRDKVYSKSDKIVLHQNGSLEIKDLRPADAASYRCRVSRMGQREAHIIELKVNCKVQMKARLRTSTSKLQIFQASSSNKTAIKSLSVRPTSSRVSMVTLPGTIATRSTKMTNQPTKILPSHTRDVSVATASSTKIPMVTRSVSIATNSNNISILAAQSTVASIKATPVSRELTTHNNKSHQSSNISIKVISNDTTSQVNTTVKTLLTSKPIQPSEISMAVASIATTRLHDNNILASSVYTSSSLDSSKNQTDVTIGSDSATLVSMVTPTKARDAPIATSSTSAKDVSMTTSSISASDVPMTTSSISANDVPMATSSTSANDVPMATSSISANDAPMATSSISASDVPMTTSSISANDVPMATSSTSASDVSMTTSSISASDVPMTTSSISANDVPMATSSISASDVPMTTSSISASDVPMATSSINASDVPMATSSISASHVSMATSSISASHVSMATSSTSASEVPMATSSTIASDVSMATSSISASDVSMTTSSISASHVSMVTSSISASYVPIATSSTIASDVPMATSSTSASDVPVTTSSTNASDVSMTTSSTNASDVPLATPTRSSQIKLSTRKTTLGCGGNFKTLSGGFQSPRYPLPYPPDLDCIWIISVPNETNIIELTIQNMSLEQDKDCRNDYLTISDVLGNQVGRRHCGSSSEPIRVQVRGGFAAVELKTDSTVSKRGFRLTYKAVIL